MLDISGIFIKEHSNSSQKAELHGDLQNIQYHKKILSFT
jgi:hypothetical protein